MAVARPVCVVVEGLRSAVRRVVVAPGELFDRVDPATFTHLYLLGYDAEKDGEVLRLALDRFPNFIGMISSQAKRAHLFRALRERGVPAEALARVHAPVGLDIGAETPSEIAVSIAAEVIRQFHPERVFSRGPRSRVSPQVVHGPSDPD